MVHLVHLSLEQRLEMCIGCKSFMSPGVLDTILKITDFLNFHPRYTDHCSNQNYDFAR